MSTRTLINLILLIVVTVLAAVSFHEPGIEGPAALPTITDKPADSVKRISIHREKQADILLEKHAGQWQLREPFQLPANGFKVDLLLGILAEKSHSRLTTADLELSRFSLEPPKASLALDELRLDFGDTAPLSGNRYIRLGDTVHLVRERLYHHLIAAAPDYVHYALLGPEARPVIISLPEITLTLMDGKWTPQPEADNLSADGISRLVTAWRDAQAISVNAYKEGQIENEVSITLEDREQPLRFLIRKGEHEMIFARPDVGVQYHLPEESAARLLKPEGSATSS